MYYLRTRTSQIYCDVCQWQESLALVPMITSKLVPLGINYEKANGQCSGFGQRSLSDLLVDMQDVSDKGLNCKNYMEILNKTCNFVFFEIFFSTI